MISKIMQVLSGAKRDGKNICLGSDEYKELVKLLNPIALQFVNMLFEIGCVKSDLVKIQGDNFYGLRANLTFDDNNIYAFTDALIELDIRPSLIVVNDSELDLFFKPNKKINLVSNEDYLQLISSFIQYINEYESMGLKFIGWNLDCEDMVECNPNKDRDVSFSKEIFNTSRPEWIELITR
ncbi:hypothetical protein [Romboutsia timonensis]|jgi:hypothetical protein|uniref:hypothetical protein n=1 Tax=Romboutsia timonensis TaxID=1776391 RepID=UPI003993BE3E